MFYCINWVKKPYYKFNNLKSINIDHSNNLLDIILYVNQIKEYNYIIKSENIKNIKFCIGYNKSLDKSVFFMINYLKDNNEKMISFYLPRKYDKSLIEDFVSFARSMGIPFNKHKSLNPILLITSMALLVYIISYLLK